MDMLKNFDIELKKVDSYTILMRKIGKYSCCFMGFISTVFIAEGLSIIFFASFCFSFSAYFHISPYIYIKQNGINIPIFPLLRDTPVSKKDFIRSRLKYLLPYELKLLAIFAIARAIAILTFETVSLENILNSIFYIVLLAFLTFQSCSWDIYSSTRYKRE